MATLSDPDPLLRSCPNRSWYTDPDVFEREQRSIFGRRWLLVDRSERLPYPGSYLTAPLAGENVIVIRQQDGSLRAMLNVCRHRGARILLEDRGSCQRTLRCPYHSWSYGLDGALLGALQHVRVHERYGCVWINLDPDAPAFDEDTGAQLRSRLGSDEAPAGWELERLTSGHRIDYDVAANWKLIVENFMECYHCSSIHPELVAVVPEFRDGIASQALPVGHGSSLRDTAAGFTVDGRSGLPTLPGLSEDAHRSYFAITLTPNAFLNLFDDHVVLHRLQPLASNRTRVVCEWLFAPEALAAHPKIGPTVELFDRVNRQDFDACERCQFGAASRIYKYENLLVPVEHHLATFHDEVRAAITEPDPGG
jgi:Rieske 2Fe-2S family protein